MYGKEQEKMIELESEKQNIEVKDNNKENSKEKQENKQDETENIKEETPKRILQPRDRRPPERYGDRAYLIQDEKMNEEDLKRQWKMN